MKLTSQQFKKYLNEAQDKLEFKRILAVFLFVIEKKPAKEISKIVNSPPGTIYKWTHLYNKFGINGILSMAYKVYCDNLTTCISEFE